MLFFLCVIIPHNYHVWCGKNISGLRGLISSSWCWSWSQTTFLWALRDLCNSLGQLNPPDLLFVHVERESRERTIISPSSLILVSSSSPLPCLWNYALINFKNSWFVVHVSITLLTVCCLFFFLYSMVLTLIWFYFMGTLHLCLIFAGFQHNLFSRLMPQNLNHFFEFQSCKIIVLFQTFKCKFGDLFLFFSTAIFFGYYYRIFLLTCIVWVVVLSQDAINNKMQLRYNTCHAPDKNTIYVMHSIKICSKKSILFFIFLPLTI